MSFSADNPSSTSNIDPSSASDEDRNWVDWGESETVSEPIAEIAATEPTRSRGRSLLKSPRTLAMVETAFLASTASLIWLINYYFPLGPVLTIFYSVPIALVYLRWGHRAATKGVIVAGLLLSVLMGPTRSIVFLIPYGLLSLQLGFCWRRQAPWVFSVFSGSLIGTFGFFFRVWLFSILLGENLWQYAIIQMTSLVDWLFLKLNILAQPEFALVQAIAILMIFFNNLVYVFVVHLVALLVFDRLGNAIPRPPQWVQTILDL
ncbi:MAG: DUF2232 domain-containing protein [Snowella sp.]|nr:DUF2232 domain-containing protein [Snowella sp.]